MSVIKFSASDIRIVGFDLDQTLYPKSPEIDQAIQVYLYERIAEHRKCTLEEAKKLFDNLYQEGRGSTGTQTLRILGVPRAKELVQEALERADIAKFLTPNPKTHKLLLSIRKKFKAVDLITGSTKAIAEAKLSKIAINRDLFNRVITGEVAKSDGSAFRQWLENYPDSKPSEFLYIGDREKTDHFIPKAFGIKTALVNITKPNPALDCPQLSTLHELEEYLFETVLL